MAHSVYAPLPLPLLLLLGDELCGVSLIALAIHHVHALSELFLEIVQRR